LRKNGVIMKNSGVFHKTVENIGLKQEKRVGKLGPGWVEPVQNNESWVWLRQIKSGPSDESRGPDLIMKQFITAV